VKLTVDGKSYSQPLTLKMDPRVKTAPLGLTQQFTLSKQMYDDVLRVQATLSEVRALREKVNARRGGPGSVAGDDLRALVAFDGKLGALEGGGGGGRGGGGGGRGGAPEGPDTLGNISGGLNQLMGLLQGADVTPTTQLSAAVAQRHAALSKLMTQWSALKAEARRMNLGIE
jgi:hypothetical protein